MEVIGLYSSKFEKAVSLVLKHEGGYVNDPDDPGGETNLGISRRNYPNEDIKNLTVERAKEIYWNDFWVPNRYEEIDYEPLAMKVFDIAVNIGPRRANMMLQAALCDVGQLVEVDGIIGPQTLGAANSVSGDFLLRVFVIEVGGYYIDTALRVPKLRKFLYGWLFRLFDGLELMTWEKRRKKKR
ncbi:MAG: peptidoglycan-binding protein [Candidatus Aenigmatarchaeota archaeon]|nr:MAG: peptidoglycan-binding protein [Candidatus Aenigmarchaeota archaeon]